MNNKKSDFKYAIDIGNTRVHFGIINIKDLTCLLRKDIPAADLENKLLSTIQLLSQESKIALPSTITVAGGTNEIFSKIQRTLTASSIIPDKFLYTLKMPFILDYNSIPGSDRIADALYASIAFPNRDYIIIGAGTAVTINLVCNNSFTGGVIFPGVSTQLKSLNDYAPVLPITSPNGQVPLPGKSTETCIRSGVLYGITGAIQRIILEFKKKSQASQLIIATGGDWPLISTLIDMPVIYNPDMTLIGVAVGSEYIS